MEPNVREGLQDALAQIVAYIGLDMDAAEALHKQAVIENRTWATNMALLFILDKTLRGSGATTPDLIEGLRQDLATLAAQEDDQE